MLSPTQSLDEKLAKLPPGWAYPRDRDSGMAALLTPLAQEHVAFERRAEALLPEGPSPRVAVSLLSDYERVLGPDPCLASTSSTFSQRQAASYARWTASGGASIPALIAFAAALLPDTSQPIEGADGLPIEGADGVPLGGATGYAITITEFAPARYGRPNYGKPRYGNAWAFAWQVNVAGTTVRPAIYGRHRYGEPYKTWGNAFLECEMRRLAPAHTRLIFSYSGPLTAGGWSQAPGWGNAGWAP